MPPTRLGLARPVCSFCDDLFAGPGVEFPPELRHRFFHRECSTCDPQQDRSLCRFCRHLRIRHLFFCDLAPDWQDDLFGAGIRSFFFSILPSENCSFCQFLKCIINQEKAYFPGRKAEIGRDPYLALSWESNTDEMSLGFSVGLALYPIAYDGMPCRCDRAKQRALNFTERLPEDPGILLKSHFPRLAVGQKVKWDQITGWLQECAKNHERCSENNMELDSQLKTLPNRFMVVDVAERKIVKVGKGRRFVALSYVWGNKPDDTKLRATRKTIERLRRRNGVSAHELPATIEDAIQICIELGERYLWVDRLCIIEDNHSHKQEQINQMASIYASASLVIVVTEGDMESGIPGVRHKRPTHNSQNFPGSKFWCGLPGLGSSIKSSRWVTRGWTYQEAVLARKKLFFTPRQVYYMCESNTRSEIVKRFQQQESFSHKSMKLYPTTGRRFESCLFSDWGHHLEAYTARSLSHSSDIYNAFIGICSAIYNEEDPLLCGLPRKSFNQALLWCCKIPDNARPHQIRTPKKDEDLPSWSWSSVMGQVSMNGSGARESNFCESITEWGFKRSGNSNIEPVMHSDDQEFDFSSFSRFLEAAFKSSDVFARDFIPEFDEDIDAELLKELENRYLRDKTLLISIAPTARFRLKKHKPHSSRPYCLGTKKDDVRSRDQKHYFLEVVNEEGHCIGMMAEGEPRVKDEMRRYTEMDTFEFVALSISSYPSASFALQCVLQRDEELLKIWKDSVGSANSRGRGKLEKPHGIFSQRSRNLTFYNKHGVPLDPVPVVNVMLIGRDRRHSLLAHRVSIGWILLTHWVKAKGQFKTIFLE